jgi:hypothetical protein
MSKHTKRTKKLEIPMHLLVSWMVFTFIIMAMKDLDNVMILMSTFGTYERTGKGTE